MSQTRYQVTLSVDGDHKVSVQSDDPASVTEGLIWAHDTYKKLSRLRSLSQGAVNGQPAGEPNEAKYHRVDAETGAPICGVHGVAMAWVDKNGGFWSCHKKTSDGRWCDYRPPS